MRPQIVVSSTRPLAQRDLVESENNHIYAGIVSWHSLAAAHLVDLVKANPNMTPVILADATNGSSIFPERARVVILIDLWGVSMSTAEYMDELSAAIPGCVFLALDRARNEMEIARLLRAGFAGFITHNEALYLLGQAIHAVAEGQIWTSPEVIRVYMNLTSKRPALRESGIGTLTSRENQILDLLRRRYSNKEMAMLLRISESIVKFHVSNVLMKLNVNDRRDLTDKQSFYVPRLASAI